MAYVHQSRELISRSLYIKCLAVVMIVIILLWAFSMPIYHVLTKMLHSVTYTDQYRGQYHSKGSPVHHIHVSLCDKDSEMSIMWSCLSQPKESLVQYDSSYDYWHHNDKTLAKKSVGKCVNFKEYSPKGLKTVCKAILSELMPGHSYSYNIHLKFDNGHSVDTSIYKFTTLSHSQNFKPNLLVYGDLGTMSKSIHSLIKESKAMFGIKYSAILHIGDIAYDMYAGGGTIGDEFMRMIQPIASRIPYMTVPGDHERFQNFAQYRYRFSFPEAPWPMPLSKLWYGFSIGQAYILAISSEVFFSSRDQVEPMLNWLYDKLEEVTGKYPWLIVASHRPLYCTMLDPDDCNSKYSRVRQHLDQVFNKYNVDLVISGHAHSYVRSWPTFQGKAVQNDYRNAKAPVYIVTGMTGAPYMTDWVGDLSRYPWAAVNIANNNRESYSRLTIANHTHIKWRAVYADNQEILDTFWLVKDRVSPYLYTSTFQLENSTNIDEVFITRISTHANVNILYLCVAILLTGVIIILFIKKRKMYQC